MALLYLCSRLPLLPLGFGLDPDSWRIAGSSFDINHHLIYHASRFPGYPVPEFVNALVIDLGWFATNTLTAILSLASVFAFGYILREFEENDKGLLVAAYAFMPMVWLNSANTMDYMWSVSFLMLTWLLITKRRYFFAALALAIAAGSRAQSAVFLIPFSLLVRSRSQRTGDTVRFILIFIAGTLLVYVPLYMTYGLSFIHRYRSTVSIAQTGYQATRQLGLAAVILSAILLATSLHRIRGVIRAHGKDGLFIVAAVAVTILSFAAAPYHIEYLILFVPFGLVLASRIGPRSVFIALCFGLILHGFLTVGSIRRSRNGRIEFRALAEGAVPATMAARAAQLDRARAVLNADIPNRSVVICGPWLPVLAYLGNDLSSSAHSKTMYDSNKEHEDVWDFQRKISYRYLVDQDELKDLLNNGYRILYIEDVRDFTLEHYHYDLEAAGASRLEM